MFAKERRQSRGFTLIELLVTVAIIGIIAVLVMPNLLDSLQKAKQKRTLGDMRDVGTAWYSWFTDQVSAAAAGSGSTLGKYDFSRLTSSLSAGDLLSTLHQGPLLSYISHVPPKDGWGVIYEYRWSPALDYTAVIGIRSLGRDAQEGPAVNPYTMGPFPIVNYDEDIVWADGFFLRYPAGSAVD